MTLDAKAGFKGIVTATGEVTADRGALRVADNVSLVREGALAVRSETQSTSLSRTYKAAFPYKGTLYYVDSSYAYWRGNTVQVSPAPTPAPVRADVQSAKEARGNLYLPSSAGVHKVTDNTATSLDPTGLSPIAAYIDAAAAAYGGTELLAPNQQVAYRALIVQTDVNGVIVRSRPTGAIVAQSGASAATPFVSVGWRGFVSPYKQTLEVYRTRIFPTTVTPDEEYQLVKTYELPASITTSYGFQDHVLDGARGGTLYTSPSRGGIESANDRPPGCACIERYRTHLFFGNIVGPHRYTFSYNPTTANLAGSATGVGIRMVTANTLLGSPNITVTAGTTTGLQVGMMVMSPGFSALAQVTSVIGSSVAVNRNATGTTTGQNNYFYDAVSIDGSAALLGVGPGGALGGVGSYSTTSGNSWNSSVAQLAYTVYEQTPPVAGYTQTLVIERIDRGGSTFQVRATHGGEMSPVLPLGNAASGLTSTNDVLPHGLYWSEPDEPEHVPPRNFARVGDAGKAILALIATRDRLLIFKEDGLFMLTGDVAKNFAIYPLDTTCLCVLPGSVKRVQNTVFALTNLGLVAVDESGSVSVISRPIQNEMAPIITAIRQAQRTSGLYYMTGLTGITGTADDPAGEYWLALGTTTPSFGGQVLVWNTFRQGFTTYSWSTTPAALSQDGEGQPLVLTTTPALLSPSTVQTGTTCTARIAPHAFTDPALLGKFWSHIVAGFSQLPAVQTTPATTVSAIFTSSEATASAPSITEAFEVTGGNASQAAARGTLLRMIVPAAMRRAFMLFVEITINTTGGLFVFEFLGVGARENTENARATHSTGST